MAIWKRILDIKHNWAKIALTERYVMAITEEGYFEAFTFENAVASWSREERLHGIQVCQKLNNSKHKAHLCRHGLLDGNRFTPIDSPFWREPTTLASQKINVSMIHDWLSDIIVVHGMFEDAISVSTDGLKTMNFGAKLPGKIKGVSSSKNELFVLVDNFVHVYHRTAREQSFWFSEPPIKHNRTFKLNCNPYDICSIGDQGLIVPYYPGILFADAQNGETLRTSAPFQGRLFLRGNLDSDAQLHANSQCVVVFDPTRTLMEVLVWHHQLPTNQCTEKAIVPQTPSPSQSKWSTFKHYLLGPK